VRRLPLIVLLGVGGILFGFALFLVVLKVVVNTEPYDCSRFSPEPGAFQAGDYFKKKDFTTGLQMCGTLEAATEQRVRDVVGPPDLQVSDGGSTVWTYAIPINGTNRKDSFEVFFSNGRVARLRSESSSAD